MTREPIRGAADIADHPQRSTLRLVARSVVSLVVGGLALLWFLAGSFNLLLRCDEACGSSDPNSWEWFGQFALMLLGVALTARALVQGFTDRGGTYRRNLLMASAAAVVWLGWALTL